MRTGLKLFGIGVFIFFLISCRQMSYFETARPTLPGPDNRMPKKVVIMPFADYSPYSSLYGYLQRNVFLMESLNENLFNEGLIPALNEDVVKYLFMRGIIRDRSSEGISSETISMLNYMEGGWSNDLKRAIGDEVRNNMLISGKRLKNAGITDSVALDGGMVRRLGKTFGASYIIRGRIVEFGSGKKDAFHPSKTGALSFFFKLGHKAMFGVARSDTYEEFEGFTLSNPMDMAYAENSGTSAKGDRILSSFVDPVVRLLMIVQDASSGMVIFSDIIDVSSVSIFGDSKEQDRDEVVAQSIHKGVKKLISGFIELTQPKDDSSEAEQNF